jgi:hypothetical protein
MTTWTNLRPETAPRLTVDGDDRLTEAGEVRILEVTAWTSEQVVIDPWTKQSTAAGTWNKQE